MVHKLRLAIEKITAGMAVFLMLALVTLSFLQVVLRNLFSLGFNIVEEFMRNGVLWIGFIGAILTTLRAKHISIDILPRFVRGRGKRILNWILSVCASLICLLMSYYAWQFVKMEIGTGAVIGKAFPAWIVEGIIPLGFLMLAIVFPLRTLDDKGEDQV